MSEKITVPHFANESEEADWWFSHREENGKIMAKAMQEGRVMNLKNVLERHSHADTSIAVQVDPHDLERARIQAAKRGVQYEDYIRQVLHQALQENDAA
jgi:predicted DNA binding CopG/RHH family protein